jgi:hypothetical protein
MKYNPESVTYCKDLLLQHGALKMIELMAEEAKNNDYRVELHRMKQ